MFMSLFLGEVVRLIVRMTRAMLSRTFVPLQHAITVQDSRTLALLPADSIHATTLFEMRKEKMWCYRGVVLFMDKFSFFFLSASIHAWKCTPMTFNDSVS